MIHVLATIEVAKGKRDAFLVEFRKVMPLVQAEAGCIEYGPAVDIPTGLAAQPPMREDAVTIIEKWSDLAALQTHMAAQHMTDYRARVKDLALRVTLHVLQPAL